MKKNNFQIGVFLLLLLSLAACGKKQQINVSQDRFFFDVNGGTMSFNIEADCDWSIKKKEADHWVTLSQDQGSNNATVEITVQRNQEQTERNTMLDVVSANGNTKKKIYIQQNTDITINSLMGKLWFLRFYERWDLRFDNQIIDESYRSWTYYIDLDSINWFFYFMNENLGYQVVAEKGDTIYYTYHYEYFPNNDSLYMSFETVNDTVEEYYARVHELTDDRFVISNEYKYHQFEKLHTVNITAHKRALNINPAKITKKTPGTLIPIQ